MRTFLIIGHEAPTTAEFSLDDIPGAGRLDVLCRSVVSGLLLSHGIREDTRVVVVLDDTYTLRFDGETLRQFHPDERSTAARIRSALDQREEAVGHMEVETSPGVYLSRLGLDETLSSLESEGTLLQLHDQGTPVAAFDPPENPIFVLSDDQDIRDDEQQLLDELNAESISLGPERLHADQAITVAHNWLDTDGYESYG